MFLDALAATSAATLSVPIASGMLAGGNVGVTYGLALPISVMPQLGKLGIFDHKIVEAVSKEVFEAAGKTLTGHWMDCTGVYKDLYPKGVSVGFHRIRNHHFITDAVRTIADKELSVVDFFKHLATDVGTIAGLPILPESMVRFIASALGVSATKIMPWVSLNILDIGASVLAISHAGSNVTSIISGTAQWGLGYAVNTFGVGTAEVVSGIASKNPILIMAGGVDIACGFKTAYDHYTQPFFCGVPVADILGCNRSAPPLAAEPEKGCTALRSEAGSQRI